MSPAIQTALTRLETLGAISDRPDHLERTFLSPANLRAAQQLIEWMDALGMATCRTRDGSIRGILPGANPDAPPLLIGSHIDTVINAGKYDGALGLISALAALETLRAENITLPFPVHVLGFSDEEGMRFQSTYLGSRCMTGTLDEATLGFTDANGCSVAEAIDREGWSEHCESVQYLPGLTRGYIELHIEQGRILEDANEAACIVSGIAGQTRLLVTIEGRTDHAGTTPMELRRDALTGAAECILAVESMARDESALIATVGKIDIQPGASNSIPQAAAFTIDFRHPDDPQRHTLLQQLEQTCRTITAKRELAIDWKIVQENDAVPCDPQLTERLLDALEATSHTRRIMPSGAGHDGVAISRVAPIGMIFVRCRDGLSHHPDEFATPQDIATGIEVLTQFLRSHAAT